MGRREPAPLTREGAVSEGFFILRNVRHGGRGLLALLESRAVVPASDIVAELPALARLRIRYEDVPMSLADACLVRMAELRPGEHAFTLEADFRLYRLHCTGGR